MTLRHVIGMGVVTVFAALAACGDDGGTGTPGGTGGSTGSAGGDTGGTMNTGGTMSAGGSTSTGMGGQGGDAACTPECGAGFTCCGGACVNLANDVLNCGACGVTCTADTPFCDATACAPNPCEAPPPTCGPGGSCCGTVCCAAGQLCCEVNMGGPSMGPQCFDPVNGTCPGGCPACQ